MGVVPTLFTMCIVLAAYLALRKSCLDTVKS
jgi:hypothetical protein